MDPIDQSEHSGCRSYIHSKGRTICEHRVYDQAAIRLSTCLAGEPCKPRCVPHLPFCEVIPDSWDYLNPCPKDLFGHRSRSATDLFDNWIGTVITFSAKRYTLGWKYATMNQLHFEYWSVMVTFRSCWNSSAVPDYVVWPQRHHWITIFGTFWIRWNCIVTTHRHCLGPL